MSDFNDIDPFLDGKALLKAVAVREREVRTHSVLETEQVAALRPADGRNWGM